MIHTVNSKLHSKASIAAQIVYGHEATLNFCSKVNHHNIHVQNSTNPDVIRQGSHKVPLYTTKYVNLSLKQSLVT